MLPWLPLALAALQQPGGVWSVLHDWEANRADAALGATLTAVGDVDGDGLADFAAGAPDGVLALNVFGRGQAVVHSSRTGMELHSWWGLGSTDGFGASVAGIGDADGDGIPDVAVGTRVFTNGYVRIYSGATGGLLQHIAAPAGDDGFGWSLAPGGDLDGDGHADFAVGARGADPAGRTNAGRVLVYSGLTFQPILSLDGTVNNLFLGKTVAGGQDADGDGTPDFLAHGNGAGPGSVHLFSGRTGQQLRQHDGVPGQNVALGHALAFLGDLDQDGGNDYIIADQYFSAGGLLSGAVSVHSGATGAELFRARGEKPDARFGSAVACLGDVNGDGSPDFAVGASRETRQWSTNHTGTARVYSGADFLCLQVTPGDHPFYDKVFEFGAALAGIGDADGDGRGDLAVGAPGATSLGLPDHGRVFVYGFDSQMRSTSASISTSLGGHWAVDVEFSSAEAGRDFLLLPSPVDPDSALDEVWVEWRGVKLPIIDSTMARMMRAQVPPGWYGTHGTLDAAGRATAGLVLPPGGMAGYAGNVIRFAAVLVPTAALPPVSSGALSLRFLP